MHTQALKAEFLLNPDITFLNFGSFGACPRAVFDDYQKWQLAMERDPVQFITIRGPELLLRSRTALGKYVNCDACDLVYVSNPSYAVNMVARSFGLGPGDEVLTTDLEYGACDKTWAYYAAQKGFKLVRQKISLPIRSKDEFIADFFEGLTPRTKAIFISHMTSTTALVLPVSEICDIAKQKGIYTFVDGAHAPGHLPLDLGVLNADVYTGACHKWMMTPKGCSFVYVHKAMQPLLDPLVISWGYEPRSTSPTRFIDYHQGQGTRDFSAFLTVPAAIAFMNAHQWPTVAARCRGLVLQNAPRFCELLSTAPLCPLNSDFLGQMFSIPIHVAEPKVLQRLLYERYQVEIPVMPHLGNVYLRYSINGFNSQQDLDVLYNALSDIMATTNLLQKGG